MDLGELKRKEVVDGHHDVAGLDQRQIVVWEVDQRKLGAQQGERQQRLLRQPVGLGVDGHQVRRSADLRPNDGGVLGIGNDGQALPEKGGEFRKQPANIAAYAKRPDEARVEADSPFGQTTLMVSDP